MAKKPGKIVTLPVRLRTYSFPWMLEHLALVYGESIIVDLELDIEMSVYVARINFGAARLRQWLEHSGRRIVQRDDLSAMRARRRAASEVRRSTRGRGR